MIRLYCLALLGALGASGCTNDYGAFIIDGSAGSGGTSATGGSATGGASTGGTSTGGAVTGGASTGGAASGGASTGGGGQGGVGGAGGQGGSGGGALWPLADWGYRKKISLQSSLVAAPVDVLTDFPVLISRLDADIEAAAQNGGEDIRFTASDGSTPLDHEIERFTNSGRLAAWVRVPSLSALVDTEIYVYYGNPAAADQSNAPGVWVAGHEMVLHLQQSPGPGGADEILDTSGNGHHGTAQSSMTNGDLLGAKISRGLELDGFDDYLDFETLNAGDGFTISAWLLPQPPTNINAIVANSVGGAGVSGFRFFVNSFNTTDRRLILETGNGVAGGVAQSNANVVQDGQWNHVAVTVNRAAGQSTFFHNGTDVTADGYTLTDFEVNSDFEVGRMEAGFWPYDGVIDEVRISTVLRSAEWLKTSYQNQDTPAAFHVFGMEEVKP